MACVEELPSSESANDIILEHAYSEDQEKKNIQENDPIETASTSSSSPDDTMDMEVLNTSDPIGIKEPIEIKAPDQDIKTELAPEAKVKSRELKSLLDAVKESNLDTNIAYKRRTSLEPNTSQESGGKRAMRSQNPDFLARHKKFLHKVNKFDMTSNGAVNEKSESDKDNASLLKTPKRKKENFDDDAVGGSSVEDVKKSRKSMKVDILNINMKKDKDSFCWRCHRDGVLFQCETCPRGYHPRCLKQPVNNPDRWPCPECLAILQAESTKTRSPAMRDMSLEHLCELLKYAAKRMMNCVGSEPFIHPVDIKAFPDYQNYVVQPMDLTTLQSNIRNNVYGSTVAFMADAKWILHNSIIYNSYQSKLTTAAKSIVKICKQEMSEIETCSECYQNANTKKNSWFVEVCSKPHILLWAKLKGFPYWPAKAMTTNAAGLVDVRFFGAHDRAWIPIKECFLYSKKDPNTTNKNKRNNIAECIKEVDIHIEKLKEKFGEFYHAPYRTPYDPTTEFEQLAFMLPKYVPSSKIKPALLAVKPAKTTNGEDDLKRKRSKTPERRVYRKRSKSRTRSRTRTSSYTGSSQDDKPESRASSEIRSDCGDDTETLTSSSKTSINSDEKIDKLGLKFSQDFEKFMEGYGTEDDDSMLLNNEARKNIIDYDSSDDDSLPKTNIGDSTDDIKNGNDQDDDEDKLENISETAILSRGKVRTRGGYHNVTGKVKILSRKRNSTHSPTSMESPAKLSRRNSDISTKSDSSRLSGISRVEEFSDMLEVSLGNTSKDGISSSDSSTPDKKLRPEFISTLNKSELSKLKPVIQVSTGDLYTKNKEFRISPQNKPSVSIADRLMKKITASELTSEAEKIESVKKQILENLESSTSCINKEIQNNEDVSSSDNTITKKSEPVKNNEESKEILINTEPSTSHSSNDVSDKNQNVSSSTESTSFEIDTQEKNKETCGDVTTDEKIDEQQEKQKMEVVQEVSIKKDNVIEESNLKEDKKEILENKDDKSKENDVCTENKIVIKETTEKVETGKEQENTMKKKTDTMKDKEKPAKIKVYENKVLQKERKSITETVSSENNKDKLNPTKDNSSNSEGTSIKEILIVENKNSMTDKEISLDLPPDTENIMKDINSSEKNLDNLLIDKVSLNESKQSVRSVRAGRAKLYEQMELDTDEEETSNDEEDTSEDDESLPGNKINKIVKIVNVSDILTGKISSSTEKLEPTSTSNSSSNNSKLAESTNIVTESIDIKSEPQSEEDEESEEDNNKNTEKHDVTLTIINKQKRLRNEENPETTKTGFKIVDNMTRIIDSVASNYSKEFEKISKKSPISLNRKEITLKPISKLMMSPKQKARKSFPNSPHKMQQVSLTSTKKVLPEKREILPKPLSNVSLKVVSTLQSVPSQISSTTTTTITTTATATHKENMVVVASSQTQTTPVISSVALLPPNQPITLTQNVGNSILAMVHSGINTSNLIIQQTSTIPASTQITTSNSQCTIVTPSLDTCTSTTSLFPQPQATEQSTQPSVTDGTLPESISKAVGELLCKPPPRLKPRPPGPLSNHYDEGCASSAGPTTNLINSISHRLTDYFRGLLKETLNDLSSIGDPESRIRSLELELETVKHKHAEEMLELRKNISSILKDIQKSIVEEKAKIVDETRAACEAERLRCVEEAKSKQWCAFCYKEAQFYCCWNTSYCDYPCQQKHWATHMKTCSQTTVRNVPPAPNSTTATSTTDKTTVNTSNKPKQQTYSNPNKTVLKSTRMIVKQTNKQGLPMYVPVQRPMPGNQQTITLVESTPGNFEIVGNHGPISLGGKLVPTTTIKVKPGNLITVASTASNNTLTTGSGTQKTIILSQKAPQVASKISSENKT